MHTRMPPSSLTCDLEHHVFTAVDLQGGGVCVYVCV